MAVLHRFYCIVLSSVNTSRELNTLSTTYQFSERSQVDSKACLFLLHCTFFATRGNNCGVFLCSHTELISNIMDLGFIQFGSDLSEFTH